MHTRFAFFLALGMLGGCSSTRVATDGAAMDRAIPDVGSTDAASTADSGSMPSGVGAMGGTVDRLLFGVFGDVRPPSVNQTADYPTAIVTSVMEGMASLNAQFAVASGDYQYANDATDANAQVQMLLGAAQHFPNQIFYAMGNHDCDTATASNCSANSTYAEYTAFRTLLTAAYPQPYWDFVVHTGMGDAHFIIAAANAWSTDQASWLNTALAQPARYTFVVAHEPSSDPAPGTMAIETAVAARTGGVTLKLYGHYHEYQHLSANAVIVGNGGASLNDNQTTYGFGIVSQREDGNLVFTAYNVGNPPVAVDSFVLTPDGALTM